MIGQPFGFLMIYYQVVGPNGHDTLANAGIDFLDNNAGIPPEAMATLQNQIKDSLN